MPQFCESCRNLLQPDTSNDVLTFRCMSCFDIYKSDPDDTLRYEETQGGGFGIFQTILNKAVKDHATIREFVPCPKCKAKKAKRVRLGDEMRLINICESCNFQWIEMGD